MSQRVLIFAPHPDDESITGLLPLRLQAECGFEVWAAPVSLGSREDRRAARRRELVAACAILGFRVRFPKSLSRGIALPGDIRSMLESIRPALVMLPHAKDGHPTHRTAHRLGVAAMDAAGGICHVAETEYWHPLERPNLMVAGNKAHLRILCRALACHRGEIARNDYAARLPAWMSDNVRRGTELVGGKGAAAPDIAFATLYRIRRRSGGRWSPVFRGGRIMKTRRDFAALAEILRAPIRS